MRSPRLLPCALAVLVALLVASRVLPGLSLAPLVLRGDVNADGRLSSTDALGVLSAVVGRPLPAGWTAMPHGDANCDGRLTSADALLVLSHSVGRNVSAFCVGQPLVSAITISPAADTLFAGDTLRLRATATGPDGAAVDARLTWTSLDSAVARVDPAGLVTTRAPGSARVVASAQGQADTAVLTIRIPALTSLEVVPAADTLNAIGDTLRLRAVGRDSMGQAVPGLSVGWHSLDPGIASVNGGGLVQARAVGTARVRAFYGETLADTALITVRQVVARIDLSAEAATVLVGTESVFSATARDSNSVVIPGVTFTLSSSDPAVATVEPTGDTAGGFRVAGLTPGSAVVTVAAGEVRDSILVTVATPFANVAAVSIGAAHSCAITSDGKAYCAGENRAGQLGTGDTWSSGEFRFRPVATDLRFSHIAASGGTTCALTLEGAAYCWGIGYGRTPVPLPGGVQYKDLSGTPGFYLWEIGQDLPLAESRHCAVGQSGTAYCWTSPNPVPVDSEQAFTSITTGMDITTGRSHQCALTAAQQAYCWGSNEDGQLGTGDLVSSPTPRPVAGGLLFADIDAGVARTCAVTTGGDAYCWGTGYGPAPQRTSVGLSFTTIEAAGGYCALTADGALYCAPDPGTPPARRMVDLTFRAISSGATSCAITRDEGYLYCNEKPVLPPSNQ